MKFRIHFEHPDGTPDSVIVEGDDVDEIREKAQEAVSSRNGRNPWSEEIAS